MKSVLRLLLPLVALSLPLAAQTDSMLRKARAYLGDEAALAAVNSVHYKGKLVSTFTSATGETRTNSADIEIIFAKPFYQQIEIRAPEKNEVTSLDDYEAWQRIENPENAKQWRMTLLDASQVRRLRANTWENLSFFSDISTIGGRMEDFGMVAIDGKDLHKIGFFHSDSIVFYRYFDPASGKLVLTETDAKAMIRESGENRVSGVRFPQEVTTESVGADGARQLVNVKFDSVTVNEVFPASLFKIPSVVSK
jgi:outer membrane lipoprotein-sorting protein